MDVFTKNLKVQSPNCNQVASMQTLPKKQEAHLAKESPVTAPCLAPWTAFYTGSQA